MFCVFLVLSLSFEYKLLEDIVATRNDATNKGSIKYIFQG
jgi:hypothetical protein